MPVKIVCDGVKREVSEKTHTLYDERTNTCGQGTKEEHDNVEEKIKKNSLTDFEEWVDKWADKIGVVEGVGDTRRMHEGVKALDQKREKPFPTSAQLMCTHSISPHHMCVVDNRLCMLWTTVTTVVHSMW